MITKIYMNFQLIKFVFLKTFDYYCKCVIANTTRLSNWYILTNYAFIGG